MTPVLLSDRADYRGRFPDIRPRLIPDLAIGLFLATYGGSSEIWQAATTISTDAIVQQSGLMTITD